MSDPSPPAESRSPARPPRSYLGWSVAATVLCFLPLGLVAVAYGLRVQRALADGDEQKAARMSRVARRWLIATVVVGILVWLVLAVALLLLGAFSP